MTRRIWFVWLMALALALAAAPAEAQGPVPHTGGGLHFGGNLVIDSGTTAGDTVLFGGNGTVRNGATVDGNFVLFGGNLHVEQGSKITRDVVVFGGNADLDGEVGRDISIAGGNVNLGPSAVVNGSVNIAGGNLSRNAGAVVHGDVSQSNRPPIPLRPGTLPEIFINSAVNRGVDLVRSIVSAIALAALGALLVVFLPGPVRRVTSTVQESFLPSLGVGCLTPFVAIILAIALSITIIGIPVAIMLGFVAAAAYLFGWIAIGFLAGERILDALKLHDFAPVLAVIVGVLLIAVLGEVPCIGGIINLLIGTLGLGAVVLTRFGTRPYPYTGGYGSPMGQSPLPPAAPQM